MTSPAPTGRHRGPWWLGAVPVLALLSLVTAGAAIASPTLRHQLDVSTHRLPTAYVELAFASPTAARTCSPDVNAQGVQIALTSHLTRTTAFGWHATGAHGAADGTLTVAPGSTGFFAVPLPSGHRATGRASTLTVTLDGRAEKLVLHCSGRRA